MGITSNIKKFSSIVKKGSFFGLQFHPEKSQTYWQKTFKRVDSLMIKRIVGVITIMNNWAVQSIGYNTYRPLGRPEVIAQNLDRWQLEEIVICDISRSRNGLGPNIKLLETIAQ